MEEMVRHLQREIEKLKKRILHLGALVETNLREAVQAITSRDESLANKVIETDLEVDRIEVDLEEECLKVLALHQPVAGDLRFLVSLLKINNDLERIGDLAVNIAKRARDLAREQPYPFPFDMDAMADKVQGMVRKSLDAYINHDAKLAYEVGDADDEIDATNRTAYAEIEQRIRKHPERLHTLLSLFSVSRYLERIADHATNISEDIIYMLEGEIVRHQKAERFRAKPGEASARTA